MNVVMRLHSIDAIQDRYGRVFHPSIVLACFENKTDFYIDTDGMFVADIGGYGRVIYRFDSEKSRTLAMKESTDNRALGLWRGAGIQFIKKAMQHQRLLLQITPYNDSPYLLDFDLAGLVRAAEPLRSSCNW
jgi:type VI secretion system VasI family protein